MHIKNVTTGTIILGDIPNVQGGSGLIMPAGSDIYIFNEDAEKSVQLGTFLISGGISNLGPDEPSTGSPEAETQPGVIGSNPVLITNSASAGKALVAISTTQAQWLSTSGTLTFVDNEIPMGLINGTNVTFTLANLPASNSVHLYLNGLRQSVGIDYTILGSTITFNAAPTAPGKLVADYRL